MGREIITLDKKVYSKLINDYENLMCLVTERYSKANTPIKAIIEAYNEKREEDFNIYNEELRMIKLEDLELNSKTIIGYNNNGYKDSMIRLDRKKEIYAIGNTVYIFTTEQLRDLLKAKFYDKHIKVYDKLIKTIGDKKK